MHGAKSVPSRAMRASGWIVIIATLLLSVSANAIQGPAKTPAKTTQNQTARRAPSAGQKPGTTKSDPDLAWLEEILKNPDLMNEVNHLFERLAKEMQYPPVRTQSVLLPRLPQNTVFYFALPNFGPQLHQSLEIYRQELHDSAILRDFLQKNHLKASEPKFEDGIAKVGEFLDYLGDELVVTGGLKGKDPSGVFIAEVRKPGLRTYLEKIDQEFSSKPTDHLRIFDPQQLESATDQASQGPVILIRSDFVLIGTSTANLRDFNAQLDKGGSSFASSHLGKRLAQSYQAGTTTLLGVDAEQLMGLIPATPPQTRAMLEKAGFADARYAVMEGRLTGEKTTSQMELTFSGPRHGIASWIAPPAQLGALGFMSAKSSLGEVFRLKSPAMILDDIADIAGPGALAMVPQMESHLNVNLRQDILSKLTGEIGFTMQTPMIPAEPAQGMSQGMSQGTTPGMTAAQPSFTVILGVSDPAALQQTIKRLLTQAPMQAGERQEDGVTFYTLTSPSANGAAEINYFFLDGYLVIGTNRALAEEALRVHRNGESLAKSSEVANAAGQPAKASALVYQNAGSFITSMLNRLPAELLAQLPKNLMAGDTKPNVMVATADDSSIRAITNNSATTDASVALVVAAIAIPNLLRSKVAANESAAAASVRTVNTAEVTYAVNYPQKGYAASLAVMGPGASGDCAGGKPSSAHACLLDGVLGNSTCIAGKWCEKNGYRFSVRGICSQTTCNAYVATATPMNDSSGGKSFCSTMDAVIRSHTGPPLTAPLTAAECNKWAPIQ